MKVLKALGGSLLVGGTAIGAGMLALPIVTAQGGFFPSIFIYLICYIFSTCTGLLFLEITLVMPKQANMVSMASHFLGRIGKIGAWILYLFLFYCLSIAYVSGGGHFVASALEGAISPVIGQILFVLIFGACVYLGTRVVDWVNGFLMLGLVGSYFLFIYLGFSNVNLTYLKRHHLTASIMGLPVIFTSFSYQGVIPSLTTYLERNAKMVRFSILLGAAIPFIAYIIWQFLILGIVPLEGPNGLLNAQEKGLTAIDPLRHLLFSSSIFKIGQFFGAFALTTSFLGVTLGLLDFLSDGLKIAKIGWKKGALSLLVFVPPICIASLNPNIFIKALGYAGGVGCALLLGLMPILMVWRARYFEKSSLHCRQLLGGRVVLTLLAAFVIFELGIEIVKEFF